jgi:hypothetical protein
LPDVIEFLESRSIQTSGGRGTGTRVFHVTGTTSVRTVHNLLGKAGDNGVEMPNVGDAHPDFPGLRARDFSVSLVAGHNDTWRVDWTYEVISRGFPQYPTTVITELPNEVGYLELSSEIRAEFVLAWRKNGTPSLTYPQNGQVTNPTQDIRGEPVDQAGNPISVQRNIQELTITENVESPAWSTYRSFRFCRNSASFFGAAPGLVLYRGASVRRIGVNVYSVAHSFVEDGDFHLQQSPLIEAPDMTPKLRREQEGRKRLLGATLPGPEGPESTLGELLMADEITINASLQINDINLVEAFIPGTLTIDFATAGASSRYGSGGVQAIGTSVEQITQGDTTDGGVYFFRNIDETNFVEIGVTSDDTSGGTFYPVLKLLAGEYSVGRLSNATIFAQADTAAVNLQFRMLSP